MNTAELRALVERYLSGGATEAEKRALQRWYESNFDEFIMDAETREGKESDLPGMRMMEKIRQRIPAVDHYMKGRAIASRRRTWHIAASFAGVLVIMGILCFQLFRSYYPKSGRYIFVSNPAGSIRDLYLPDSTHVWLNAGSTMKYPDHFNNERSVELNGEAYFNVAHHAGKPFRVQSGKLKTRVLGTSFNVKAYASDDRMDVAVERGKVAVSDGKISWVTLKPGQQLSYSTSSGKTVTGGADLQSILAWRTGELRFNAMRLEDIASILERRYNVKINFAGPKLRDFVYSASFGNTVKLNDVLMMLCSVNRIEYKYSPDAAMITFSGKGNR